MVLVDSVLVDGGRLHGLAISGALDRSQPLARTACLASASAAGPGPWLRACASSPRTRLYNGPLVQQTTSVLTDWFTETVANRAQIAAARVDEMDRA